MPVYFERYQIDHGGISDKLMSDEVDDALRAAGNDVISYARGPLGVGEDRWANDRDAPMMIRGYPRGQRRVSNDHPAAPAREFGSGKKRPRPQGGSNEPTRALGKAGARVGDYRS